MVNKKGSGKHLSTSEKITVFKTDQRKGCSQLTIPVKAISQDRTEGFLGSKTFRLEQVLELLQEEVPVTKLRGLHPMDEICPKQDGYKKTEIEKNGNKYE